MKKLFALLLFACAVTHQAASVKISAYPQITVLNTNDYFLIDQYNGGVPVTKTVPFNSILTNAVDPDAYLYINSTGISDRDVQERIINGITDLKTNQLWNALSDAVIFGKRINNQATAGTPITLKGGTAPITGAAVVRLDYGLKFDGTGGRAVMTVPDARVGTLIVIYDKKAGDSQTIVSMNNSASVDPRFAVISTGGHIQALIRSTGGANNSASDFPWHGNETYIANNNDDEHTVSLSFDNTTGANAATMMTDAMLPVAQFTPGFTFGASTITKVNIGCLFDGTTETQNVTATIKAVAVFNRVLTSTEVRQALRSLRWFDLRTDNYFFVGDSTTCKLEDSRIMDDWPRQFMNWPGITNRYFWRNLAVNGTLAATWDSTYYANYASPYIRGGPVKNATMIYRLGINDVNGGSTAATAYTAMKAWWALAKADGWNLIVSPVTMGTNYTGGHMSAAEEAVRQTLNTSIVSDTTLYDGVVRFDLLFPDMLTNRAAWSLDGLHQNATGKKMIAGVMASQDPFYFAPSTPRFTNIVYLPKDLAVMGNDRHILYTDVDSGPLFPNDAILLYGDSASTVTASVPPWTRSCVSTIKVLWGQLSGVNQANMTWSFNAASLEYSETSGRVAANFGFNMELKPWVNYVSVTNAFTLGNVQKAVQLNAPSAAPNVTVRPYIMEWKIACFGDNGL